jgi:UDP-N-acetylglucosamine 1-carboxyvinyltransferase
VVATESRAAAAYVVAGLCAEGSTHIAGAEHLERVYSDLAAKLRSLGAHIEQLSGPTRPSHAAPRHPHAPAIPAVTPAT